MATATRIEVQPIEVGVLNLQGGELLLVKVPGVWQMPGALEAIKAGFKEALDTGSGCRTR